MLDRLRWQEEQVVELDEDQGRVSILLSMVEVVSGNTLECGFMC